MPVNKATNTHSEYVIRIAFPLQKWLQESVPLLRYTYTACLVIFRLAGLTSQRNGIVSHFYISLFLYYVWPVAPSRYNEPLRTGRFGIRTPVKRDIPRPYKPAVGPIQPPMHWLQGSFRGKATGAYK